MPSLWDQLVEAVTSLTGHASTGAQRSRPPCNTDAISLQIEIESKVRWACRTARIRRTFDLPKDLRQLMSAVIRDADPDNITAWQALIRHWVALTKLTISNDPDRSWRMPPGVAACPICSSETIPVWNEYGEESRGGALIVHSEDGRIDTISCDFCTVLLTGDDLTQLLLVARKQPAGLPNATDALQ